MLDPKCIRERLTDVQEGLSSRGCPQDVLLDYERLDKEWRQALQAIDVLKNKRNQMVPKQKPTPEQLATLKELSDTIKVQESALEILEQQVSHLAIQLPNIPDKSVPVGLSEEDNVEVLRNGVIPQFDFTPLSHEELGQKRGVIDMEAGAKITGARFAVMRQWGAKLERMLMQWLLDVHTQHGYEEILPPAIVNTQSLIGTGQLPKFAKELFKLEGSSHWLSPTSEVQLTNLYRDTVLSDMQLPIRLTGVTPCFRSEAGSAGKDTTGLIRLHQFHKVELVHIVRPEESMHSLETLTAHVASLLDSLKLPYRILSLCTGDLGFSSAKTYDLEVWFPSQNTYREVSSCSNFLDFQARRAMIRFKSDRSDKPLYVHTLNGSGLPLGRLVAAILENYQLKDGRIGVPDVLQSYMGVKEL